MPLPASPLSDTIDADAVPPIDGLGVAVDLETCLRLAGARAPELERARARMDVVRAHSDLARLRFWPSLQPAAGASYEKGRIVSSTGDVPSRRDFWSASLGVGLRYLLNPMEAIYDRSASLLAAGAASFATEAERQIAMRRAGALYVSLQESHALASLAQGAARVATKRKDLLQDQAAAGLVPATVLADVELDVARRAREHHLAASAAHQRSIELAQILRLDPRVSLVPVAHFRAFALVDPATSFDALVARAEATRPDLEAAARSQASRETATSAAQWGAFAPSIALSFFFGGVGRWTGSSGLGGPEGLGERTSAGLGAFEVLSPEAIGRIDVAAALAAGATFDSQLLAEAVRAQVVAARTAANDAHRQCELTEREVAAARAAHRAAAGRLAAGLDNGVETLVRIEDLAQAEQRAVQAVAHWNRTQLELLFALGSLGPAAP